ncbi:MAG: hypothetical protein AAGG01_22925, partial [Planctomycetota bacterium]
MLISVLTAAALLAPLGFQSDQGARGFDGLGLDPYTTGLFEEVDVTPGPPARVLAQTIHGEQDGASFVNVLRWTDARRFRGNLITVNLPVRLDAPTVDTTARLWVRMQRADGSTSFDDLGADTATSSSEWTSLGSTFAVGADATDLWFGMVVEGPTQVHFQGFSVEVHGAVSEHDVRHGVPERWAANPDVKDRRLQGPERAFDLRVTTFVPPGHAAADLPRLWLLREDDDLLRTYSVGRALLEGMRLGQDPPGIVQVV